MGNFEAFFSDSDHDTAFYDSAVYSSEPSGDEHDAGPTVFSDDEEEVGDPISIMNTLKMRQRLKGQDISAKVRATLGFMDTQGINLPIFLDALSWGDIGCHSDPKIRYARTALLVSTELPGILDRWYRPPRSTVRKKGKRPTGARRTLREFAIECVNRCIDLEMKNTTPLFHSPPEDFSEDRLIAIDFSELRADVIRSAPVTWRVLRSATYSQRQESRNKHKDPDMVVLNMISQAHYTRSHQCGRVAKIWAIYLKACGLSARAFDAIHYLGITMSHKWAADAYSYLSNKKMEEVRLAIQNEPWTFTHDNINLPLRVFSQRIHNQSHFISGCAATVWVLPRRAELPPDTNRLLQKHRALTSHEPFPLEEVMYGNDATDDRIEAQHVYRVLRFLLDSPDFSDYQHLTDPVFDPPPPVNKLPFGSDNITREFILGTCAFEEASYDGTLKVMAEWFRQLHLDNESEEIRTALERVIAWIGDQLTVERLRGLWKYRHEDMNSFDRMDYMIPVFGWFHLVMAFANSLHKQYLGTSAGIGGLRHAFDVLKRKGLIIQSTKGPFWHNLDEALKHICEAHFRACWLVVGKAKTLTELKKKNPQELRELAGVLVREHASQEAIAKMDSRPVVDQDQVQRQWTMWNMDILPYLELREAISIGDIGRMEDLLPILLFRFAGGGNPKYTIEILELLQGLRREWTDDVRNYIREWCWVLNQTGKEDGFLAYDLAQEHNIGDIKVNYRSLGPGATMDYVKKISPAIPTLRKIQRHIESQFKTCVRGAQHGIPDKEKDVVTLTAQYTKSQLHVFIPGRKLKAAGDRATDVMTAGAIGLEKSDTVADWFTRRSHPRSTLEDWST